jgi:hypothetical protein
MAVVWRGDREAPRTAAPQNNHFRRVFEELSPICIRAEHVVADHPGLGVPPRSRQAQASLKSNGARVGMCMGINTALNHTGDNLRASRYQRSPV